MSWWSAGDGSCLRSWASDRLWRVSLWSLDGRLIVSIWSTRLIPESRDGDEELASHVRQTVENNKAT
jgi:hypothetical protein